MKKQNPVVKDSNGNYLTCEVICEAMFHDGDYHKNVDSAAWLNWLKNMFIPCFDKMFEGKKCFLVLDNAPYHKAFPLVGKRVENFLKEDSIAILKQHNVKTLVINEKKYVESSFSGRGSNSPTAESLKAIAGVLINLTNKSSSMTMAEIEFIEWSKKVTDGKDEKFHKIIWTIPYYPQLQPIELLWGVVKNHAGREYFFQRKVVDLIKDLKDGFDSVLPSSCEGMVKNAKTEMEELMKDLGANPGPVENFHVSGKTASDEEIDLDEEFIQRRIDNIRNSCTISNLSTEIDQDQSIILHCNFESKSKKVSDRNISDSQ
jgi:hypothetical protein